MPNHKITDQAIIDFIRGNKITGNLSADARRLGYQGDAPNTAYRRRLESMFAAGLFTEEEQGAIKAAYKRWGEQQIDKIDKIDDQTIIDFIRQKRITGNLSADARALGYQGDTPNKGYKNRLECMFAAGLFTEEEQGAIKAAYKQWGRQKIDKIDDQTIIDFIRQKRITGNLSADARALGYQGDTPNTGYKNRLECMFAAKIFSPQEIETIKAG